METINETSGGEATQTTNTETTAQSATGTGVQPTKEAGAGNDGATSEGTGGAAKASDTPQAYVPSFKFKVKDKELDFDDFVKPVVKTKDVEQKIKDLYEKAHGLDEVKTSRDSFKAQADEWKGKYTTVETSLQTLGGYVKKDDFRSFFQALNIPKEKIIKYAIEELKYQEMPADQRAILDAQREKEQALEQTSFQNQTLQQQMAQMIQKQTEFELNQELTKSDVAQAISAYDTRLAKPGAFKAEVIRRGQYYEAVHKTSPPASQLVAEVLSLIGVQAQAQQGTEAASQGTSSQTVQQSQKPVISSFQGSGAKSPARKVPQSIEDLRKMRQQLTT